MRAGLFAAVVWVSGAVIFAAAPQKPLSIQNVAVAQYEDGPPLPASSYYLAGETVFLSFQVAGYRKTGEDEPKIRLSWRVEAKDPAGIPIVAPAAGKIEAALSQEDKNWMPKAREAIQVPPFGPTGTYHLAIVVKDELANAEVRAEREFQVHGQDVEPSPTLVLRKIHFYRTEQDKEPLALPVYRPGDAVWIRFEIVGFKLGEQNRFEVAYGITVLRASGDVLFQQPEAAVERDHSFYPRHYVPAALSLNLTKDLAPGQYTVVLTVEDKVGGQKCEERQTFGVER